MVTEETQNPAGAKLGNPALAEDILTLESMRLLFTLQVAPVGSLNIAVCYTSLCGSNSLVHAQKNWSKRR